MARRQREVTVREGTSKRHWYPIAAYLAAVVIGTVLAIAMAVGGNAMGGGGLMLLVTFVFVIGGVLVMPSLFKDAAYIRDTRHGWRPKWWYYIGIPLGVGIVTYPVAAPFVGGLALGAAATNISVGAFVAHALYMYRRHKFLGVP